MRVCLCSLTTISVDLLKVVTIGLQAETGARTVNYILSLLSDLLCYYFEYLLLVIILLSLNYQSSADNGGP